MDSAGRTLVLPAWVSPFGHLRLITPACGWPRLIAACHVLHRLLLPRHPPCALSSLTIKFTRHTAGFAAAFSYQQNLHAPANFMGLILLIARLRFSSVDLCAFCGCCFLTTEYTE